MFGIGLEVTCSPWPLQVHAGSLALRRRDWRRDWKEDANGRAVIFCVGVAFDLDLAAVPLNQLLCNEQANACAHGIAGGEEGIEDLGEGMRCDTCAVILDGENNSIERTLFIFYGDG